MLPAPKIVLLSVCVDARSISPTDADSTNCCCDVPMPTTGDSSSVPVHVLVPKDGASFRAAICTSILTPATETRASAVSVVVLYVTGAFRSVVRDTAGAWPATSLAPVGMALSTAKTTSLGGVTRPAVLALGSGTNSTNASFERTRALLAEIPPVRPLLIVARSTQSVPFSDTFHVPTPAPSNEPTATPAKLLLSPFGSVKLLPPSNVEKAVAVKGRGAVSSALAIV